MKRLIVLAVLFMTAALCASAQYKEYYVVEQIGSENPSLYKFQIDWNNKLFFLEGDNHNDGPIKNYKEDGNVRTFDVFYAPSSGLNEKIYTVKFTADEGDNYTIELDMNGYKAAYKLTTQKPVEKESYTGSEPESVSGKIGAKTQAMKAAIGKGVTKGLDAIKNKAKNKEKVDK